MKIQELTLLMETYYPELTDYITEIGLQEFLHKNNIINNVNVNSNKQFWDYIVEHEDLHELWML